MSNNELDRQHLVNLVSQMRNVGRRTPDFRDLLEEFESVLPGTDIENLCASDYDNETIVDMCLGDKHAKRIVSREELLAIVRRLCHHEPGTTEAESNLLLQTFIRNCRHPGSSDLIYYPEEYFNGRRDPAPEEIVEKAIQGS